MAEPFPISLQAISKHLNVLERAGLVVRTRETQWRRCRLDPTPLRSVAEWIDQYRRHWDERYDTLTDYLTKLQGERK